MADESVIPELARSLRALGVHRDASADAAHAAIFVPLIEARSRAVAGTRDDALGSLRGAQLSARIQRLTIESAEKRITGPALARAFSAQAQESIATLLVALRELDRIAEQVREPGGWDRWIDQLKRVFTSADAACQSLATVLAERAGHEKPRRWFERSKA